jgi:L-lactate dehydrogenase complex protein LldF
MKIKSNQFPQAAHVAIQDIELRRAVKSGTDNADQKRAAVMRANGVEYGENLRQQGAAAKRHALRDLPDLLEQAEANLQAHGVTVLWAADAEEARQHVLDIARQHDLHRAVKSKSMISEEIALNAALEANGLDVLETDLGEFIIQLEKDVPSHLVAPVIHKSKQSIADLFVEKLGMAPTDDAEKMTHFAREHLRQGFLNADLGISGGNFVIAETGTLCLVTNEGNGRMVTSLPRVHVALVGIEKIVPTFEEYVSLTQLLARGAVGQLMPVYTHMINGPRHADEADGPEHVYVIFVDNGRSRIYATEYAEVLACIRCGACVNTCPVYEVTGGHAYGWVYPGPIGAIVTPLLQGLENATPLPYASSLCGKCKAVCPVDIDLPRMLLALRRDLVEGGHVSPAWGLGLDAWAMAAASPGLFRLAGQAARLGMSVLPDGKPLPGGPLHGWTQSRDLPRFAPKPFRQLWDEQDKDDQP